MKSSTRNTEMGTTTTSPISTLLTTAPRHASGQAKHLQETIQTDIALDMAAIGSIDRRGMLDELKKTLDRRGIQRYLWALSPSSFPAVAAQLALHCPDLSSLKTSGAIKPEDAAAMPASLPRLRSLCLDSSYLPKQELLAILAGCTQLEEFSARNCVGFNEKDEEVVRRGARIERFEIGGSRFVDVLDDEMMADDEFCGSSYVDVM
ncbi:hypothetical protein TRIUR3_20388 [Triticum urartu]|uniref:F-box/LRR-repeat protein 15/At3g58940/PEG3-like LRR domain-containing protein n=1 Tax=Triticum urartu TaxID=4572 RepID=M7ZSX2_TRIUA|nr:hypothetical protein TRIUR3_20388 [Triticum urartu]